MNMRVSLVAVLSFAVLANFKMMSPSKAIGEESVCDTICKCSDVLHFRVECEWCYLKEVPHNIPGNVVELDLKFNELRLHDGDFAEYQMLKTLDLSFNRLKTMPRIFHLKNSSNLGVSDKMQKNSGTNAVSLKKIILSGNNLKNLPEDLFHTAEHLVYAHIDTNHLESLPAMLFSKSPRVQDLSFAFNNIKVLPETIFTPLWDLDTLILSNNSIHYLSPRLFRNNGRLRSLWLDNNKLVVLQPQLFFQITSLYSLRLSNNFLKSVPKEIFLDVVLLNELDMSMNSISALPRGLFNKSGKHHDLITLFLHRNKLTYLQTDAFVGLPKLQMLCLFGNKIAVIGLDVFGISALETIYLFGNELSTFSHNWFKANNKATIYLFDNNITKISGSSKDVLKKNNTLYANCNYLQELQRLNVKLVCVGPSFAPKIQFGKYPLHLYMRNYFQPKGFTCQQDLTSKSYTCNACPRGSYSNGKNKCILCPKGGFYQDKIAKEASPEAMNCQFCPNGTYVRFEGGWSDQNCTMCPDGTVKTTRAGFRACPCKDGFARRDRFGKCFFCKQRGLMCNGQDFQSLKPGFFWNWNFSNCSLNDYNNFASNLRTENRSYDNNTQYHKEIPRVHRCPRLSSCLNDFHRGMTSVEGRCSVGYTGWLCTECQPGFYSVLNFCRPCPEKISVLLRCFVVLGLYFILCCVVCWNSGECQITNHNRNAMDLTISEVKIVLGFYQVVGGFLASLHDAKWIKFYIVADFISVMEMNVLEIFIHPLCLSEKYAVNPKTELFVALIVVFGIIGIPFFSYVLMTTYIKIKRKNESNVSQRLTSLKEETVTVVFFLLFITYPPICLSVFQLYPSACRTFCLDVGKKHCFTALRSDFGVPCDQLAVYHVIAFASTAGYVAAFPLLLLYCLRKHCPGSAYSRRRKVWMKSLKKVKPSNSVASKNPEHQAVPPYLKFLCENYKSKYWYWEVVELKRKVTQTLLITILGWQNNVTILLTFGISVFFLVLNAKHMPVKSVREQSLQMVSLCAICTNILLIAVETPTGYKDGLSWFLLILNVSILFIFLVEIFLGIIVRVGHIILHTKNHRFISRCLHLTSKCQTKGKYPLTHLDEIKLLRKNRIQNKISPTLCRRRPEYN